MPACLIKDEDGVCVRRHGGRDLFKDARPSPRYYMTVKPARAFAFGQARTTPWIAGIGPASTIAASARLWSSLSFEH
jgi:hypothetical protein